MVPINFGGQVSFGLRDVMIDLAREDMTMIVVTHEMVFAKSVAHRVRFMDYGQIVEANNPEDLFTTPRQERTKRFLSQLR